MNPIRTAPRIEDISIADFTAADISGVLEYWYRSPRHFLVGMGVSPEELPREKLMREMLEINVERSLASTEFKQAIVSIKLRGETIGVHELTHVTPPAGAIMHAHIWSASHRGLGIGIVSYVKAMQLFFERFGLDHIFFETPAANVGAQKIKSRLGIEAQGTGSITWPIVKRAIETVTYRVSRSQLPQLETNMRAEWERRTASHWPSGHAGPNV